MNSVLLPFGKSIIQTDRGQSVSSDTAFLVETILQNQPDKNVTVLELGCGNGIISIILAHYRRNWKITGIDIQSQLIELARSNAVMAEVGADFLSADIRNFCSDAKFDIVIANPPYYPLGRGLLSPNRERAISRHELFCNMEDVMLCSRRNLLPDGIAYIIYPAERLNEAEKLMKKVDLKYCSKFILNSEKGRSKVLLELKK